MKEVCSPSPSKIRGGLPLSPGARSNPSRLADSVPEQPTKSAQPARNPVSNNKEPDPGLEVEQ
jgi:hypothetical protein